MGENTREAGQGATPLVIVSSLSQREEYDKIQRRYERGAIHLAETEPARACEGTLTPQRPKRPRYEAQMEIRIDKESEVPLRQQLTEQIIYLIVTGQIKAGQPLPSVRELARRLRIHHNTVSEAYQDLASRTWLVRRRGSRVVVRAGGDPISPGGKVDLDDLINAAIRTAREQGYSLQQLRERVRERLLVQPPDHFLVVEEEPGLRRVLAEEIRGSLRWPVESCSRAELASNPGLAIGALAVAPEYAAADIERLFPKDRPMVSIAFSTADDHRERIRQLRDPSVIVVVSISKLFLQTARGLLAHDLARRHVLREFLLPVDRPDTLKAADLIFADSAAMKLIQHPRVILCRLVSCASLEYLATAMASYQLP